MIVPLGDTSIKRYHQVPYMTWALMITMFAITSWTQTYIPAEYFLDFAKSYGVVPANMSQAQPLAPELKKLPNLATVLSYMFVHDGWAHLIGNFIYLLLFAPLVEDSIGRLQFLIFFLLCGAAAVTVQIYAQAGSADPIVGASGAIGGMMGAYLMLAPRAKMKLFCIFRTIHVPMVMVFALFVLEQVFGVLNNFFYHSSVAWWAHIGGFIAGMVLIPIYKRPEVELFKNNPSSQLI